MRNLFENAKSTAAGDDGLMQIGVDSKLSFIGEDALEIKPAHEPFVFCTVQNRLRRTWTNFTVV